MRFESPPLGTYVFNGRPHSMSSFDNIHYQCMTKLAMCANQLVFEVYQRMTIQILVFNLARLSRITTRQVEIQGILIMMKNYALKLQYTEQSSSTLETF